jgi:ParB family transcriptional regulator, chromosome partitioning protein
MKLPIKKIPIANIRILRERRPLVKEKIRVLAESMDEIGLKTPITVRARRKGPVLVVGRHRLEAAKSLKWTAIRCFVFDGTKIDAELWTVSENLHRAELTALNHAEELEKWEQLLKVRNQGAQAAQPGGRQPHDKGVSKTAKALGTSREQVQRSRKIASISPAAKTAAIEAGLDSNATALLEVAKEKTSKAQLNKVRELAKADVELTRANFLRERSRRIR